MNKLNKKISIAIGTATLAIGMMALPVLANTSQNMGYSNGTSVMSNQGSMQGANMTGNRGSARGTTMTGNQGSAQGTSMMSAFMQKLNGMSGAFLQFFGM